MDKFFYVANIRLPTERAHGIQIMEMCGAFADAGLDVQLVVPRRHTSVKEDAFVYHDVKKNFSVKRLWCIDATRFGRFGFFILMMTFNKAMFFYMLKNRQALFYTRDAFTAWWLNLFGRRVVWEGHMGHGGFFIRSIIRHGVKIVVITEGLRDLYVSLGAKADQIIVAADGADLKRFDIDLSKEAARKALGLPEDKAIILYKGSLEAWKGAGTLAESAEFMNTNDLLFVFIGGTPEDVTEFKKRFARMTNISILGNRPRRETPVYQKAADILVIPNSAKEDISKLYTSPMKLFGYMAGGRPIIASDLPSLREILSDDKAYFFIPDDARSLARTIDTVLADTENAREKAGRALALAEEYSWQKRAKKIIQFIHD
ncbi:MAG: hypothetical protein JWN50_417 [Parcubacteria group bacterium]|nr:hypothetical protein [Parcubacteria group bacterium]